MSLSDDLMARVVDNLVMDCEGEFAKHKLNTLIDLMHEGIDFNRTMQSGKSPRWIPSVMVSLSTRCGGSVDLERMLKAGLDANKSDAGHKRSPDAAIPLDVLVYWRMVGGIQSIASEYVAYQDLLLSFGADPHVNKAHKRTSLLHKLIIWGTEPEYRSDWKIAKLLQSPYLTNEARATMLNEADPQGRRPVDLAIDNIMVDGRNNEGCVSILLQLFDQGIDIMKAIDARPTPPDEVPMRMLESQYQNAIAKRASGAMSTVSSQGPRIRL